MIILDITESPFITDIKCDEADRWMEDNVGTLIHDDPELAYGDGWRLAFEPECKRWIMQFENDIHASLFLLRWS
jgi:hypothetical protein